MSIIIFRSTLGPTNKIGISNERGMEEYVLLAPGEDIEVIEVQEGDYLRFGDKYKFENWKIIEKFSLSPQKKCKEYINFIERYKIYNILGYQLCSLPIFDRNKWYHKFKPNYRTEFLQKMNDPKYQGKAIMNWQDVPPSVKEKVILRQNEEDLYEYFIKSHNIPEYISLETKEKILEKMTTDDRIIHTVINLGGPEHAIFKALDKIKDEKKIVEAIQHIHLFKQNTCLKLVSKIKDERLLIEALKYIKIPKVLRKEIFSGLRHENMYYAIKLWWDHIYLDDEFVRHAVNTIEDDRLLFEIAIDDQIQKNFSTSSCWALSKIKDKALKDKFYEITMDKAKKELQLK